MKFIEKRPNGTTSSVHPNEIRPRTQRQGKILTQLRTTSDGQKYLQLVSEFLSKVFLPDGYPTTVSPDYMRYQVLNALQAFCSSLAGMLSSRATLEGYGVGNASASATDALLLSVLQDIFGRMTTILAAYYYGSSLMPEAKTYRFLADILYAAAMVLETLSPLLASLSPIVSLSQVIPVPFRVYTLCLSSSLRALCGISAGGSKTAIALHFATPLEGTGNIGDLNAKDSSKETVLGLMGMLLGTIVVPYLTTPFSTYSMLLLLILLHLGINFAAVRGIILRTLNRQRTSLAWCAYRDFANNGDARAPSPSEVASIESIFHEPSALRANSGTLLGHCAIGSSIGEVLSNNSTPSIPSTVLDTLKDERYILWFDPECITSPSTTGSIVSNKPRLHIFLKDGHRPSDHLKAWIHATEAARVVQKELLAQRQRLTSRVDDALHNTSGHLDLDLDTNALNPTSVITNSYDVVKREFSSFTNAMIQATWTYSNVDGSKELDVALMTGPPVSVITEVIKEDDAPEESRKDR